MFVTHFNTCLEIPMDSYGISVVGLSVYPPLLVKCGFKTRAFRGPALGRWTRFSASGYDCDAKLQLSSLAQEKCQIRRNCETWRQGTEGQGPGQFVGMFSMIFQASEIMIFCDFLGYFNGNIVVNIVVNIYSAMINAIPGSY